MTRQQLPRWIFSGLVGGAALGALSKLPPLSSLNSVLIAAEPLGTAFIRLVTMIVVPLVIASLFTAVGSLGDIRRLGDLEREVDRRRARCFGLRPRDDRFDRAKVPVVLRKPR